MTTARRLPALPALTGIRFFAAIYVVLYHYASEALSTAHWSIRAVLASGPSAVGLFYVLSGAVLVYSSVGQDGGLATSRRAFWRARVARIYPIYFLALLLDAPFFLSAVLKVHDGADAVLWSIALAIPALLLVHGWTALTVFAWNTPGWSLSAEAFFYALFPSAVGRLRCDSLRGFLRRASVFYVLALIPPLLVTAARLWHDPVLQTQVPAGPGGIDLYTWLVRFCGFSPLARLPEFLIGICLGHWLRALRSGTVVVRPLRTARAEAIAIALVVAALMALGAQQPHTKAWLDSGLLSPVFVLLIVVLAIGSGPCARALSTRPLQVLGDASYAIYVLQEPVLIWMLKLPLVGTLPPGVFLPIFVATLIVGSMGCQRFIAEPVRRRLLARPPERRPAPQASALVV
jgi:peptidoglycan/LPS O-acetylase OafA/YrhL